jgi:hypothetical protein
MALVQKYSIALNVKLAARIRVLRSKDRLPKCAAMRRGKERSD